MADAQGILQRVFDDGAQALRVLLGGTVAADAPSSPVEGDFWYESDTGSFFVRVGGSWVEIASGGGTLHGLSDVTISSPAGDEVLAYDTGTSEWINQTAAEAGLAAASHTHTAAATTFTPDGSIAATNVQDAIEEVRDEAGSALAIGAAVGGQTDNTVLFTDASGNLDDNVLTIEQSTLFGVADFTQLTAPVASAGGPGWANATPLGAPFDVSGWFLDPFDLFAVTDPVGLKSAMLILNDTPGTILPAGHFGIGLGGSNPAAAASSAIYLDIDKTTGATDVTFGTDIDVLDFSGNVLTDIGNGSASSDAAAYGQIIPKTIIDAAGDLIVGTAADTAARLAMGTALQVLRVNAGGTALEWATASGGSPGGSDTYVQYNDGGAFGGEAAFTYDETNNRLTVTGGYRMDSGSGSTIGDSGGSGHMYFDANAAHVYGYAAVHLRDTYGEFAVLRRSGAQWINTAIDTAPLGGGSADYGMVFSGGTVSTYDTKVFVNYFGGKGAAAANGDDLYGVVFRPQFTPGAYTGLTQIGVIAVTPNANSIGFRLKATAAQAVDMLQVVDSSDALMFAVAKNGAVTPASLADSAAANGTIYYSTDAGKLVYKDSGGSVNALY